MKDFKYPDTIQELKIENNTFLPLVSEGPTMQIIESEKVVPTSLLVRLRNWLILKLVGKSSIMVNVIVDATDGQQRIYVRDDKAIVINSTTLNLQDSPIMAVADLDKQRAELAQRYSQNKEDK